MPRSQLPGSAKQRHPPSIRDVAELAGVSLGSASRVVNGAANLTPAIRDKVQAAIAQLAFVPNHAARSLRSRSTRTIGCMLTDVTNPLYAKLYRAVEERLRAAGYMTLLANSLNSPEREIEILSTFQRRGMDGVLIAPGNERDQRVLQAVEALTMPVVILDRDMATTKDRVMFDHVPGMRTVIAHLAALGHRKVGLILGTTPNRPTRRRIEGFRKGFADQALPVPESMILRIATSMSPAFDEVLALLLQQDRPTALIAHGTTILDDTLNAVHAAGLRVPEDISVVSLGDPLFARSHRPAITSSHVDLDAAASASASLLLERIRDPHLPAARSVRISMGLIERPSCGPAGTSLAAMVAPSASFQARVTPTASPPSTSSDVALT